MAFLIQSHRWTGGRIPYVVSLGNSGDLGKLKDALSMIEAAVGAINTKTVLTMVPRASERDYLKIVVDWTLGGGRSAVGRRGRAQTVLIDPGYNPPWALIHELAHAVGMIHEHQRPDRDGYVTIAPGAPSGYAIDHKNVPVGAYDCHSTMAYNEDKYLKYIPGACSPTGHGLSKGDVEALAYVYRGSLGAKFESYDWTSGWTTAFFYEVAGKPYLFFLKAGDGTAAINAVTADGKVGGEIFRQKWSTGWTTAFFYEVAGKPYMFLLKAGDGTAAISRVTTNGKVGQEIFRQKWSKGWTTAFFYEVAGKPYMFFLKAGDGTAAISPVTADGKVGEEIFRQKWSTGWTTAFFYEVAGKPYMFFLKAGDGTVAISPVTKSGEVGEEIFRKKWSKGWTTACFYEVAGRPYMFFLKKGGGTAAVTQVFDDGTVGRDLERYDWSSGWTNALVYRVNTKPFMFLLKSGSGRVDLHRIGVGE